MAVNLSRYEVWAPNNSASAVLMIGSTNVPASQGGALKFVYRSNNGSTLISHIFSPVGYSACTLSGNNYEVLPNFGFVNPIIQIIQATFVGVSDEDGTVMFENYDNANGSRWPVAFFPRDAYVWVRYAGAALTDPDAGPVLVGGKELPYVG